MTTAQVKSLMLMLGIAMILSVLCIRAIYAARGKTPSWEEQTIGYSQICTDGMRFGFSDDLDAQTGWKFKFFTGATANDANSGTLIGTVENVALDTTPFNEWCNYYAILDSDIANNQWCKGTMHVAWTPTNITSGTEIAVRAYYPDPNTGDEILLSSDPGNPDFATKILEPVTNCKVNDTPSVELVNTGTDATPSTVTNELVFRIKAYDPNWDDEDGTGIREVVMNILGPDGVQVYSSSDTSRGYCAFGGDDPCTAWNFTTHNYKWPNGQAIQDGTHTLRAFVSSMEGFTKTLDSLVQVQLPTATSTPTSTPTNTPTPSPTSTRMPTQTPTPSATPDLTKQGLFIPLLMK